MSAPATENDDEKEDKQIDDYIAECKPSTKALGKQSTYKHSKNSNLNNDNLLNILEKDDSTDTLNTDGGEPDGE